MPEMASAFHRSLSPEDAESFMTFYLATVCTIVLTGIPAFVGLILYQAGVEKAGLYLILANLVLWLLIICYLLNQRGQSSGHDSDGIMCYLWVGFAVLCRLIICFTVALVASNTKDEVNDYFKVNRVDLTRFELVNTTSTLNYTVSVILGPSHGKLGVGGGVYFEELKARAYYQGHSFGSLSYSYYNSSNGTFHLLFRGRHELALAGDGLERYRQDTTAGRFTISVTVSYLGFRSSNGSNDMNKATGDYKLIKGAVTFELEDVPLSDGTQYIPIINGGWVAGLDRFSGLE